MGGGHPGWQLADKRDEGGGLGYFFTKRAVECVFDQICSFGLYVTRYVMFLCFQVYFRTKQMKCFLAYIMLNIICLYVFMFWGMLHLFANLEARWPCDNFSYKAIFRGLSNFFCPIYQYHPT